MEKIYIPHLLRCADHALKIPVDQFVLDLETLTPVRGEIAVKHQGNYLNISVTADAIINLTCHRCLQQYNQRLQLDTSEVIWLDAAADESYQGPLELRVDFDDLVESLSPDGHFAPEEWIYEQLCLAMPQRQLCSSDCLGVLKNGQPVSQPILDSRWGSLASLKQQLSE